MVSSGVGVTVMPASSVDGIPGNDPLLRVKVPDADVEAFYNQNKAQYSTEGRVRASHILLKTEGKDDATVKAFANVSQLHPTNIAAAREVLGDPKWERDVP